MSQRLILTVGLPGSGKTTWANEFISQNLEYVNINRDDVRLMLGGRSQYKKFTTKREELVTNVVQSMFNHAIEHGRSVIVSDTNLNPTHNAVWKQHCELHGVVYEEKLFTDVPLGVCLERDQRREFPVGQRVIEGMFNRYRDVWWPQPVEDPRLPNVYLVDLDGTLAKMHNRNPFDWEKVDQDRVNVDVLTLLNEISCANSSTQVIILSGRDSVCRERTVQWLIAHNIVYHGLFMRPQGDTRPDYVVKEELYRKFIQGKYNVRGVFDDRNQVVYLWRHLGLTCFQVNYGWF